MGVWEVVCTVLDIFCRAYTVGTLGSLALLLLFGGCEDDPAENGRGR